jgi:hypothetical protein
VSFRPAWKPTGRTRIISPNVGKSMPRGNAALCPAGLISRSNWQ